jgi:hypothetical protein
MPAKRHVTFNAPLSTLNSPKNTPARAFFAVLPAHVTIEVLSLSLWERIREGTLRPQISTNARAMQRISPKIRPLLACLLVALLPAALYAQFTTIINVPPDIAPNSIGQNTQLNLFDGGSIGDNFNAGASDGTSTNVEVNIAGGTVSTGLDAWGGSTVNISGGRVLSDFKAQFGSTVNFTGGTIVSLLGSAGFIARTAPSSAFPAAR